MVDASLFSLYLRFELTSVTPSYKKYLMHIGMPRFVVPVVMSSRETLSVKDLGDDTFRTKLSTAFEVIDVTFKLEEEYTFSYFFNQGLMHNRCTRPKPNVLFVNSFEPSKMWNLTSEMVFTKYGMINTQTIVQEQISATKFYTKVVVYDENSEIVTEDNRIDEIPTAQELVDIGVDDPSYQSDAHAEDTFYQSVETIPVNQNHHFQYYGANLWNNLAKNLEKLEVPKLQVPELPKLKLPGQATTKWIPDTSSFKKSLGWIQDHIKVTERPVPMTPDSRNDQNDHGMTDESRNNQFRNDYDSQNGQSLGYID